MSIKFQLEMKMIARMTPGQRDNYLTDLAEFGGKNWRPEAQNAVALAFAADTAIDHFQAERTLLKLLKAAFETDKTPIDFKKLEQIEKDTKELRALYEAQP